MRVYHLIKSLGRGGAEMLLPESLREAGPDEQFAVGYFLPHKDALVGELQSRGARVRCFGGRGNGGILARVPIVARDIRRWRADVVHCHLPIAGVAGRLAGRLAGVPVVYTEHNLQERYHPATFRANRATWRLQRQVVACSEDVARSIHARIGDRVPVRVVQNGVATASFVRDAAARASLRQRLGIDADAPVVATVAVFRAQKRLVTWLEVARRILDARPDTRFLLIGDGPLRDEVEAAVVRLGLERVVHRPGLLDDVRPWLSAADLYMMSSEFEGLPVALLEAMSCRLPAACTAVGGIGEVVEDGVHGALVPRDAPLSLAPAVLALLADPQRLEQMGRAARARVEQAFGMARMVDELRDVYRAASR